MKLLTVIYDAGVDESVMELVEGLNLPGYTRLSDAHGVGGSGRKLNNPVFPGVNTVLLLLLPDEQVRRVTDALYRLQATYRLKPGMTLIVQDAQVPPPPADDLMT